LKIKDCPLCIFDLLMICMSVRTPGRATYDLFVGMRLYKGSALSSFLFTLVMDELTNGIQNELSWYMLFTDDIALVDESKQEVNDKLKRWRLTLEFRSFRVSRSKTEYLYCRFVGREDTAGEVTIDGMVIPNVEKFKYLGSTIQWNGDINEDINQRIKVS